jgi:hypothetical protein
MTLGQAPRDELVLQEVRTLHHRMGNQLGLVAGRARDRRLLPASKQVGGAEHLPGKYW